ncbi:hypothetical protein DMENIID0001_077090 [Sergentomyia squamirostris]
MPDPALFARAFDLSHGGNSPAYVVTTMLCKRLYLPTHDGNLCAIESVECSLRNAEKRFLLSSTINGEVQFISLVFLELVVFFGGSRGADMLREREELFCRKITREDHHRPH